MEFNKEKFKNVLHYIVYKCGLKNNVGRTVLHKLLYFSDFNYYQIFKESITNESYKKLSRGPVPIHFEEAMAELIEENKISTGKRRLPCGKKMNRYFATNAPDMELKEEEWAVIDKAIEDLSHMNGLQIGEYSLSDEPVKEAEEEGIIDYDLVFSRSFRYRSKAYVKITWLKYWI